MASEVDHPRNIQQFFVPFLVVVAIGLAFFSGTMWQKVKSLENGSTTTNVAGASTQPKATVTLDTIKGLFSNKGIITFGDANRKVLFVEIADPSCPYCHIADGNDPEVGRAVGTQFRYVSDGGSYDPPVSEMKKLVDSGQASFAYIYFPGHGNGEMAMKALFCANEKGKFWEANELLMSQAGYQIQNGYDATGKAITGTVVGNDKTKSAALADFLKSVVDPTFMKSCLDSGKYDSYLTDNQNLATSMGLQGTPDFWINTTNFPGAYSYTDMKSAVDAALK
jgi:protein-disulfide isomerase